LIVRLDSQRFRDISLLKTDLHDYPYGSPNPIAVKGIFDMRVYFGSTGLSTVARFVDVEPENAGPLLGKDTAIALGLLTVGPVEPVEQMLPCGALAWTSWSHNKPVFSRELSN